MTRSRGGSLAEYHSDPERIMKEGKKKRAEKNIMAEEEEKATSMARGQTMKDYVMPSTRGAESIIVRPYIGANNFEIKLQIIQMIQNGYRFGGLSHEDPNQHLANFLELCTTFKYNGVTEDAVLLRLFPFSLRDRLKSWLSSLLHASITTWEEIQKKFLGKYFPPAVIAKMRNEISAFLQEDNEPLYDARDSFKEMLRKCPHHQIPLWMQIQTFDNVINVQARNIIDATLEEQLIARPLKKLLT